MINSVNSQPNFGSLKIKKLSGAVKAAVTQGAEAAGHKDLKIVARPGISKDTVSITRAPKKAPKGQMPAILTKPQSEITAEMVKNFVKTGEKA